MLVDNTEKFKFKITVSEDNFIPYSLISRNFYINSLRLGFLMKKLEGKYKLFFTSELLRILLNLYNSPNLLNRMGFLFNIFQTQKKIQVLLIDDFFEILAFLISKGLIVSKNISNSNIILFSITELFKDLITSIDKDTLEPMLNEKLDLIQNLLELWKPKEFLKFIHEEVRELI